MMWPSEKSVELLVKHWKDCIREGYDPWRGAFRATPDRLMRGGHLPNRAARRAARGRK